ncbi:uncharacterized protein LOC119662543 [Teleopsis dalmanni]|uniref:uncharacterized protein LOC119662543 n=1 Tax=Teleopsis dalmanni TaxID=139649 RepID=UPI0018CE3A37|nr:uncharacterized protein LOC119662543 [Teleopsis dalmanni]
MSNVDDKNLLKESHQTECDLTMEAPTTSVATNNPALSCVTASTATDSTNFFEELFAPEEEEQMSIVSPGSKYKKTYGSILSIKKLKKYENKNKLKIDERCHDLLEELAEDLLEQALLTTREVVNCRMNFLVDAKDISFFFKQKFYNKQRK